MLCEDIRESGESACSAPANANIVHLPFPYSMQSARRRTPSTFIRTSESQPSTQPRTGCHSPIQIHHSIMSAQFRRLRQVAHIRTQRCLRFQKDTLLLRRAENSSARGKCPLVPPLFVVAHNNNNNNTPVTQHVFSFFSLCVSVFFYFVFNFFLVFQSCDQRSFFVVAERRTTNMVSVFVSPQRGATMSNVYTDI